MMRCIVNRFSGGLRRGGRETLLKRVNQLTRLGNRELVRVADAEPLLKLAGKRYACLRCDRSNRSYLGLGGRSLRTIRRSGSLGGWPRRSRPRLVLAA